MVVLVAVAVVMAVVVVIMMVVAMIRTTVIVIMSFHEKGCPEHSSTGKAKQVRHDHS